MNRTYGRARDASIDERILAAARRHLSVSGFEGMSLAAIAAEAGTTRQALYRRWSNKAELAAAAVAAMDEGESGASAEPDVAAAAVAAKEEGECSSAAAGDPFQELVDELTRFQAAVSRPGRMSLVGSMLQETTDPLVLARYRARVIAPRRGRLRAILLAAQERGLVDADADLEIAVTLCTGSWYARALAEDETPERWPERTAALVWRSVGGGRV